MAGRKGGRSGGPARSRAEVVAASNAGRLAAGGVRVDLYVPADAAADLAAITGPDGRTAAIVEAIRAAAKKKRQAAKKES